MPEQKHRTYVPQLSPIEFRQVMEKYESRSTQHARLGEIIVSDPSVVTKDMKRVNKTQLLSVFNEGLPASQQITSRRLDELYEELKRCFEEF